MTTENEESVEVQQTEAESVVTEPQDPSMENNDAANGSDVVDGFRVGLPPGNWVVDGNNVARQGPPPGQTVRQIVELLMEQLLPPFVNAKTSGWHAHIIENVLRTLVGLAALTAGVWLADKKTIDGGTISALLGAVIGYAFAKRSDE